ncbi:hypothetical protein [Actinomadura sp. WAC 06369]|uniref:hypothetical protein n=1 Tax=Actinomadura sp. WAC 06369 TaxID=2203193 RepID=UPI000F79BEA3|nr:hypothetical protein [Actinomadura sp. WAC 06369]RSN41035.1 hypothetical protein DMH08_39130 [Actinomadura sp. WAC 06369]
MTISRELARRVCPCAADVAGRVYPLPVDRMGDEAVSAGLVRDVADLLAGSGLPVIETDSPDWYALWWCLHRFAFGHNARGRHAIDPGDDSDAGAGGEAL